METLDLMFFAFFGLLLFGTFKGIKAIFNYLKKFKPPIDSSDEYLGDADQTNLPADIDHIISSLENQRLTLFNKTKGLFKRALFRTWFVLLLIVLGAVAIFGELPDTIEPVALIGPSVMTGFLSLIFAGVYTLYKKGTNEEIFTQIMKKDLVARIASHVNPGFTFSEIGISETKFKSADLFKGETFKSEDSIEAINDRQKAIVSECQIETRFKRGKDSTTYVYFKGLFLEVELAKQGWPNLKAIPKINVENEIKHISFSIATIKNIFNNLNDHISNQFYGTLKIHNGSDTVQTPIFEGEHYSVFGGEEAKSKLSSNFHKVIDFVLAKFEYKDAFISIQNCKFYLAICWNQNMFDSDKILKNTIKDSGIVEKIHKDLLFINQILTEVSLMNKV